LIVALRFGFGAAAVLFCIGVGYAVASARLSISQQKGFYRFRAYLCVGAAICLSAVAALLYESHLPTYEITGTIEAAQIHSEGRGHRTYLRVRVDSGAEIAVSADGISSYFHPGQVAEMRYQGVSGHVLHARFLSASNTQEGVFNGTDTWPPYWWMLGGVLVVLAGIRKRRRDPEGAERS
jgi:hypothetical protein